MTHSVIEARVIKVKNKAGEMLRLTEDNIKRVDQFCLYSHYGHFAVVMKDGSKRVYENYDMDNLPETVQRWWDNRQTKDKLVVGKYNGKTYDVIRYYR